MAMTNRRRLVLVIALAVAAGAALLFCVVGVPVVIQAARETARRDQAIKNLGQFTLALEQHQKGATTASASTIGAEPVTVSPSFDSYSGYFVSNKFEPDATESFVVINSQEQFDNIFGVATVMGDKSHRLPEDAFKSNVVLAAIKRGNAVWEFKVEGVTVNDGLVELRYTTTSTTSDSATFASPLIVSIPTGPFVQDKYTVEFVENGNPVKKVQMP